MPYGERRSKRELERIAREYDRTDDDKLYQVTTERGTILKAQGINSARALAGKNGTYREIHS